MLQLKTLNRMERMGQTRDTGTGEGAGGNGKGNTA